MTKKEELLQEINNLNEIQTIRTIEVLDNGENNSMTFLCSKTRLHEIINDYFDDVLHGCVPNGVPTTILSWIVVETAKN